MSISCYIRGWPVAGIAAGNMVWSLLSAGRVVVPVLSVDVSVWVVMHHVDVLGIFRFDWGGILGFR